MSLDHRPHDPSRADALSGPGADTTWFDVPPPPAAAGVTPSGAAHRESPLPGRGRRLTELSLVALLAATLAAGGTYAATTAGGLASSPQPPSSTLTGTQSGTTVTPVGQVDPPNPNWAATAEAVTASVVAITASGASGTAQGSGVVIDDAGHIVTNNHVVDGARSLTVTLTDGTTHEATIRGTDPPTDLAVLTLSSPPAGLTPLRFADVSSLKVGDPVMAIGNPLGLAGTVTTGIVSALDRPVRTSAGDGNGRASSEPVVTNAIQTSAAINPGNSGGALVNAAGELVGINSAIASLGSPSGEAGNIGIGFAIPAGQVSAVTRQLIDSGVAQHAYLGVSPTDGEATLSSGVTRAGAEIRSVGSATPAATAGVRVGDVVTAVDGAAIDSADALVGTIRASAVGSTVTVTVVRDGSPLDLTVTLAARPAT